MQLPKESRFIRLIEPAAEFDWSMSYLMQINHSLRQLVWSKTKDAQKKNPINPPQIIAPAYVLKAMKQAEKTKKGGKNILGQSRAMDRQALDDYLKKPRKSISKS